MKQERYYSKPELMAMTDAQLRELEDAEAIKDSQHIGARFHRALAEKGMGAHSRTIREYEKLKAAAAATNNEQAEVDALRAEVERRESQLAK